MIEEALFHDALAHTDPGERAAYLDAACAGDAPLRASVEALLRANVGATGYLDVPVADWAGERLGSHVGPYKLMELIGEGGMGLVYVAEQTKPVRRKVALKVIKPGMDSRHVVARFEAERQALALMDHPNIAKVFDAGTTEAGRPFFAMELVKGSPVTAVCDEMRLSVRERLGLFIDICGAVQHAHQKGVIHRDIKPSNVLVTSHDGKPVAKVIDFGVAKAVGQTLTELTIYTQLTQVLGTPMYMSPEQAGLSGLDVDTRTDVYALGVLLYELLTGTTPFDPARLRSAGFDEMRRILRDEEPPPPSRQLGVMTAAALTTASERRGVDTRQFAGSLRGDLDWVVMKALEKDRTRRYESASALAADVRRYLADEPVEACPPSTWYRLRKYARRHTTTLVAVSVVAAALLAATTVSVWLAVKAREAERRAEAEAAIASEVNRFLQFDLLWLAGTEFQVREGIKPDKNLTVRALLDRAASKAGDRFAGRPLVEAAVRMAIAEAYLNLGEMGSAIPHFERALALRKENLDHDHPDALASLYRLGSAYGDDGQGDRAVVAFEEALEKFKTKYGLTNPGTIGRMHNLATAYNLVGRSRESIALHTEVLELSRAVLGSDYPPTKHIMKTFARAYQSAGRFDDADPLLCEALDRERQSSNTPSGRIGVANSLDLLGLNRLMQRKYAEAEPLLREALTIYETEYPDQWRRFSVMSMLGGALMGQKDYARAEPLLRQGYEGIWERESTMYAVWKPRLSQAVERLVHFYEVTNQPEKAQAWRDKLPATGPTDRRR